jgi:hypothetical protein
MNKSLVLKIVSAAGLVWVAQPAQATDTVEAIIKCESTRTLKIDWPDQMGSDPVFKNAQPSTTSKVVNFLGMGRTGQTVSCAYSGGSGSGISGNYAYVVQRRILACQPHIATSPTMVCTLKAS